MPNIESASKAMQKYLDQFPVARTDDPEAMRHALLSVYGATSLEFPEGTSSFHGHANHLRLSKIEFSFCSYGSPIEVSFPDANYTRIQIALRGTSLTTFNGQTVEVRPNQPCINPGRQAVKFNFGLSYEQLVLRVSNAAIVSKLTALLGTHPDTPIKFDPVVDLTDPQAEHFRQLVLFSANQLDVTKGKLPHLLLEELQQKIITALLCCNRHTFSDLLESSSENIAPWQVRRVEEFIAANCDKAITIEMLSEAIGASARSIFQAFHNSRGYSPMEFVKQVRLKRAHTMLMAADLKSSVTSVAFACGFLNLGHFAKDYREAFGERPSETLQRIRGTYRKSLV